MRAGDYVYNRQLPKPISDADRAFVWPGWYPLDRCQPRTGRQRRHLYANGCQASLSIPRLVELDLGEVRELHFVDLPGRPKAAWPARPRPARSGWSSSPPASPACASGTSALPGLRPARGEPAAAGRRRTRRRPHRTLRSGTLGVSGRSASSRSRSPATARPCWARRATAISAAASGCRASRRSAVAGSFAIDLAEGEPVYGHGEKWGRLDHRGQRIVSWNEDALGVNAEISYKNCPFAWSPRGWGLFVNTPGRVVHGVGYRALVAPLLRRSQVEDDTLDLFLIAAATRRACSTLHLAHRPPGRRPALEPRRLAVQGLLSRRRRVPGGGAQVRELRLPMDVITLDGRAWPDTATRFAFEWDPPAIPTRRASWARSRPWACASAPGSTLWSRSTTRCSPSSPRGASS